MPRVQGAHYYVVVSKLVFLLIAALVGASPCNANGYDELRDREARDALHEFRKQKRELSSTEFFLFSFTIGVPAEDLQRGSAQTKALITTVYICHSRGGVSGFFIDPKVNLNTQLSEITKTPYPESIAARFAASAPTSAGVSRVASVPLIHNKGQNLYCGIEFTATSDQMQALQTFFNGKIKLVEITEVRQRKLPRNLNR